MASSPKTPSSPKGSRSPKMGKLIDTIRNSPALIRKHMHRDRDKGKSTSDAPVFYAQYLGREEVSTLRFRHCNDVVDHLIETAKADSTKKLRKSTIYVRKLSLEIQTAHPRETIQVALHNIAYCAADMKHPKVFTFIAKENDQNAQLLCYAFLCNKQEKARAITLCLSKAFETAFLEWQQTKHRKMKLHQAHNDEAEVTSQEVTAANNNDNQHEHDEKTGSASEKAVVSSDDDSDVFSPEEEAKMHREFSRRESTMRRPSLLPLGNILEELENDETVANLVGGEVTPNHGDERDLLL